MDNSENDVFSYELCKEVLSKTDCENLIKEFIDFKIARTFSGELESDIKFRKSEIAIYTHESELLKKVRKIFSEKTKTSIDQQETPVSVIRYNKDGEYKPHYDFYGDLKDAPKPESGDRFLTGIFYLNDDYLGGETEFPLEKIRIKGNRGDLLIWNNLNKNRTPNKKTLHAGLPVIEGIKYIIVIWAREIELSKQVKKTLL